MSYSATHVIIKVAQTDVPKLKELLLGDEADQDDGLTWTLDLDDADGVAILNQDEVKHGAGPQADLLAEAGIPFFLEHGPFEENGEGQEVFDGEQRLWVPTWSGDVVVRFDPQLGGVSEDELDGAREFAELRDRAFAVMWHRSGRSDRPAPRTASSTTPDLFPQREIGD